MLEVDPNGPQNNLNVATRFAGSVTVALAHHLVDELPGEESQPSRPDSKQDNNPCTYIFTGIYTGISIKLVYR